MCLFQAVPNMLGVSSGADVTLNGMNTVFIRLREQLLNLRLAIALTTVFLVINLVRSCGYFSRCSFLRRQLTNFPAGGPTRNYGVPLIGLSRIGVILVLLFRLRFFGNACRLLSFCCGSGTTYTLGRVVRS